MKKALKSMLAVFFCFLMISATASSASALAKPSAVKVKAVTYNSVTIYWTKVSLASSYDIQRSTDNKNWATLATGVKATEYKDSRSLTTGKTYYYRVRAKAITTSSWTTGVKATPLPVKVTGFKVKASTYNTIQLTWTKVAGATGYLVQYLNGSTWKNYKTTTSNVLNVTGLSLGKNYSFRVRAYRTVSKKNYYGPVSATLKAATTLKAPTTVVLTSLSTSALRIQWNAVSGAKGYEIYRADTKRWTSTGTTKGIIVKNLKPGTKYSFIVRAYSGSFKGTQTKTFTFQTVAAAPTGLKVTEATDKTITLTWNKVTGAAGYQVQRSTDNKTWTNVTTATTSNKVTASGLKGNTKYYFRVRAYIKNSNVYKISATTYGAYSSAINYKTVLSAPTLTATAANASTIKLTWTAVSGAKGYMIERYDAYTARWLKFDFTSNKWKADDELGETSVTTTTARTLSDTELSDRADVYRVRAIDASGKLCTPSATVNGRTSGVYISDTDSTGSRKTIFNLRQFIRWSKISGATVYKVYTRTPISELYAEYKTSELTDKGTQYEATMYFAPKSIHSIKVYAYGANGNYLGAATNWVTFAIGDLPMYASNHSYYKTTVNSQLLYAARAINNTKAYTGDLTLKNNSQVSYSINSLKLQVGEIFGQPVYLINKNTPEEVEEYFKKNSEGDEDLTTNSSEVYNTTLNFKDGKAVNEEGRTVLLRSQIEPSANSNQTAYLYNSKNYTAWQKGFESIKTTKNSDGGYTISFTIKQENKNTNYHNGFISSFNAADFGAADGFDVRDLKVGKSTVTLVIDADGILKSYKATSPYSAGFAASFTADEDVSNENVSVSKGDNIEMSMTMSGNTAFNYTITR